MYQSHRATAVALHRYLPLGRGRHGKEPVKYVNG